MKQFQTLIFVYAKQPVNILVILKGPQSTVNNAQISASLAVQY